MRYIHTRQGRPEKGGQRKRIGIALMAVAAAVLGSAGTALAMGEAAPPPSHTLYVSPSGTSNGADSSCSTAVYSSVQAAINAASSGDTVYVCPGSYAEQLTISTSRLTLTGAGSSSIIDPASPSPSTVADLDTGQGIVAIVDVTPGTTGVTVSSLTIDGSGLSSSFSGCSDNFVGVLYQASSGELSSATVQNIVLPSGLGGRQDGLAVFVQAGPSGTSRVSIEGDTVTSYDKNGITCVDAGADCSITDNTVTGTGPNGAGAENGVQLGPLATGSITDNQISGNDWTGPVNSTEPQADYAAGILLYGAGDHTNVQRNTLTDNQIAIEAVHSDGNLSDNTVGETSGIPGSIGIFVVPCDIYCSYFGLSGDNEDIAVNGNSISFPGSIASPTPGTYGVWAGDGAASDVGSVQVNVNNNSITGGVVDSIVFGPTASGNVSTSPAASSAPSPGHSVHRHLVGGPAH